MTTRRARNFGLLIQPRLDGRVPVIPLVGDPTRPTLELGPVTCVHRGSRCRLQKWQTYRSCSRFSWCLFSLRQVLKVSKHCLNILFSKLPTPYPNITHPLLCIYNYQHNPGQRALVWRLCFLWGFHSRMPRKDQCILSRSCNTCLHSSRLVPGKRGTYGHPQCRDTFHSSNHRVRMTTPLSWATLFHRMSHPG